jgi:2-keto-4-pentenoate hydratase/2-oxohepta-3-ene-1,7-dioic acid hydratase in catechol pathway
MAKWIRFRDPAGQLAFGTLDADRVAEFHGELFGDKQASGRTFALGEVRIECPCEPSKVIALWNNFRALSEKLGKAPPAHPLFLIKPGTSATGTGTTIRRPSRYAGKIVYEGELGVVIGRTCRDISVDEARDAIFGYTCVNDVTAAQLLDEDPNFAQWTRAKCSDTFSCLGPAIATDLDWRSAHVVTVLDGVERQNYPLSDILFAPQEIVSRISADMTLYPGDVIACGTSIGVGSMKDGSAVCIRIDGIGELHNRLGA